MNCSNCEKLIVDRMEVLMVHRGMIGEPIAVICDDCETNVLTMKIVLKRSDPLKEVKFEGYLPVECSR